MDYKKLSDAIRLCGSTPKINECKEKCPYYAGGDMMKCIPVMTKDAADTIDTIIMKLNDMWTRYMVYMDETEGIKDKFERAKHCINEINDQFERGKCSNDYVEEILKEYYEND